MEIHHLSKVIGIRKEELGMKRKQWSLVFVYSYLLMPTLYLLGAVPDGYIVKVESTTVYLDWGKATGVQSGDQFKVYRAGEALKHPVTGEVLGQAEAELGQGLLTT